MGRGKEWYRKQVKELIYTTHGHELRGEMLEGWGCRAEGA